MLGSMQLPSPPGTSHREEKENRPLLTSRVSWSQEDRIHRLTSSSASANIKPSALYKPPAKSILRKVTSFPFTDMHCESEREDTPEPESPLSDASYLSGPLSRIIALDASLKDLIHAYYVLAARIRTSIGNDADVDASKPLFFPLKEDSDAFVHAIIRDLGRVMTDPHKSEQHEPKLTLPSPRPSPSKRKRGMTEDQVKHARDVATTTHSVIKFLALLFSSPTLCQVFSDEHLNSILTHLLIIPMADELPSPNSRKTCALAISLLQVQRLPDTVLGPAKDRIAYALRRGIEGELGKEGKKGSASDGLKAINDLSIYQPTIFVSTFTDLLPSVFANLLAPTLPLRVQACHALGGFVIGLTSLPRSYLHTRVSDAVEKFLLTPSGTPSKSSSQESTIVRTLRTLLNNQEPLHPAQGPVWALCVIACFLVMLGPKAYNDSQLSRTLNALCSLAMRHRKSSVRALGCLLWRCITWVYLLPPLIINDPDTTENDDDGDTLDASSSSQTEDLHISQGDDNRRQSWWKLVQGVFDMGAGISTIIGLLAESRSSSSSSGLSKIIRILSLMVRRGGPTCVDALQIVKRLISSPPKEDKEQEYSTETEDWDLSLLIPKGLFCSYLRLLSVDFKSLSTIVKPLFDECLGVQDVRQLTQEELAEKDVFNGLVRVWQESLRALEIVGYSKPPEEMLDIWEQLLRAKLDQVKHSDFDARSFANQVSTLLCDIVSDPQIQPRPTSGWESDELPSPTSSPSRSSSTKTISRPNSALKIFLVRHLWSITQSVLPSELLHMVCVELLGYLKENHDLLVPSTSIHQDGDEDTRQQWGTFCAEVLMECEVSSVGRFLDSAKIFKNDVKKIRRWVRQMRGLAWRCYAAKRVDAEDWEENIPVLLLPISSDNEPWVFSDEDIKDWENLLSYTLNKAFDNGAEPHNVLEQLAGQILKHHIPTWSSATRIVDLIVSHLDVANVEDIPMEVMELANYTLVSSYPPEPRNKILSNWLIRSVTRVVDECPSPLVTQVLDKIQEGLSLWISDEFRVFTQDEYEFDLVMPYQTILFVLQSQARSSEVMESYAEIIGSAFRGRLDKPASISETFQEFWHTCSAGIIEPAGGWSASIQSSLRAGLLSHQMNNKGITEIDTPIHTVQQPTINPANNVLDQLISDDSGTIVLKTSVAASDIPEGTAESRTPATPRSSAKQVPSTPTRRLKVHSSFTCLQNVEERSPLTNMQRAHHVSSKSSPSERRKGDKENLNPTLIESVGRSTENSVLGKRKLGDAVDPINAGKRRKGPIIHQRHNQNNTGDGEPDSCKELLDETSREVTSPNAACTIVRSKKRKVEVFDAVVVPTYQQVLEARRRMVSLKPTSSASSIDSLPVPRPHVELRRTRSATKLFGRETVSISEDVPRKKTRVLIEDDTDFCESESALHDIQIAGSDDSIILANQRAVTEASSDDDPVKVGNVTPHLVVSPSMGSKRIHHEQWDEIDPPSDDSVGPDSPSKQLVERRQRRLWDMPRAAFAAPILGQMPGTSC